MKTTTHILKHPQRFPGVAHAHINLNGDGSVLLFVRYDLPGQEHKRSWLPTSFLGAKQIFGREYGNGAKWQEAVTPIIQASDLSTDCHLSAVPKRLYFGENVYFDFFTQICACKVCSGKLSFIEFQQTKIPNQPHGHLPNFWFLVSTFADNHNHLCKSKTE